MSLEEESVSQNQWVRWLLNKDHKAELWEILAFWENFKKEWGEMKKKFRRRWGWEKYVNLLMQYEYSKKKYMENLTEEEREIIDRLNEVWKNKFIEAYMHDKILYSGDVNKEKEWKCYWYDDWKAWEVMMEEWVYLDLSKKYIWAALAEAISKMELKKWMTLDLTDNNIWDKWAEALSKMELKEWVTLDLRSNKIWDAWAEALSKMELKEWVYLDLWNNNIWAIWAEAISKMELKEWMYLSLYDNRIWLKWAEAISKMELKEWMTLDLCGNNIWAGWAEAIMNNLELKEWVTLDLSWNGIRLEMKDKLRKWVKWYKDNWINCEVIVD